MPPDDVTLGELVRGFTRLEGAVTAMADSMNQRFDAFDSRVVKTDRFNLELARIGDRFNTGEERINAKFKEHDEDIDKLAKDLDGAVKSWKQASDTRTERWWTIVSSGLLPAAATFVAGSGVTILTMSLAGVFK